LILKSYNSRQSTKGLMLRMSNSKKSTKDLIHRKLKFKICVNQFKNGKILDVQLMPTLLLQSQDEIDGTSNLNDPVA